MWIAIAITTQIVLSSIALYYLLKDGSSAIRIWAWILVILLMPFLGIILFVLFGVNLRKEKLFDLKKEVDYQEIENFVEKYAREAERKALSGHEVTTQYLRLIRLLTRVNHSILTFNNSVRILNDGPETFAAIFEACQQAKEYIYLQYYIFIDGQLVDRFAKLFEEKIKAGVEVRLIYDALGSWELSKTTVRKLQEIGVQMFPFMPIKFGRLAKVNYRNHRKILIVDGVIGFTGGINVDDKYIKDDPLLGHWTDTHLRIEGMSVNFLQFAFLADWLFVSGENLIHRSRLKFMETIGNTPLQIITSGPDTDYPNILQQYLYILYQAKEYVYIVNPYLVPDANLSMALKTVALSGVDVRIIVPENSESAIIRWTVQSFFSRFLEAVVKIYLYQKGFIHSKVILSDDAVCSIGTANLDVRSFEQNFEVNALIYDESTTLEMKAQFNLFLKNSRWLSIQEHEQRSNLDRVKEKLANLTSPLM